VLFRRPFHEGIRSGAITLTFRRWAQPRVRPGGRYRLDAHGVVEVAAVDRVRVRDISEAEAQRSGFASRDALMSELAGRAPVRQSDALYRVAFRYLPLADERARLAGDADLADSESDALAQRLERLDRASRHGPWTAATLALIGEHPRVTASRLAPLLGRETRAFKADVRKLKALGLTVAFDVGYEISPRGRAYLSRSRLEPFDA